MTRHCATAHGMAMGGSGLVGSAVSGSPSVNVRGVGGGPGGSVMKTRVAFSLVPTPLCKVARRLAKESYRPHRAACHPFVPLDTTAIVQVFE